MEFVRYPEVVHVISIPAKNLIRSAMRLSDATRAVEVRTHGFTARPVLTAAHLILTSALAHCVAAQLVSASEPRSRAVAREFQPQQPCPSTGKTTGACLGWRKDHMWPIACGGADAVSNLQWQTIADAKAKDAWERRGCPGRNIW